MDLYKLYAHPTHEANEQKREQMMFYNPFNVAILDSGALPKDIEMQNTVILSGN
jgi:hypothetical protein